MRIDKLFETRWQSYSPFYTVIKYAFGGYMHEFKDNKDIIWGKLICSKCPEPIKILLIFSYFSNAIKIILHDCERLLDAGNKY